MKKSYETGLVIDSEKAHWSTFLDANKLLRLHPNWFVKDFNETGEEFSASIRDYATDARFTMAARLTFQGNGLPELAFTDGPVKEVTFFEKEGLVHVSVTFKGESEIEGEDDILRWLTGIREYARLYMASTLNTWLFRILMNKMMLKMNPSQRKISVMLIKISLVEILVFLVIVAGYLLFMN